LPPLAIPIAMLLGSALLIFFACEFFVNGVEWLGRKLAFGQKATGTVLAAFGTALPESIVTLVAVAFGTSAAQKDIGVGAAMGGPFALSTLAYAAAGIALILCRRPYPGGDADRRSLPHLARDTGLFVLIFAVQLGLGVVSFPGKRWIALAFLAAYVAYVWNETRAGSGEEEEGALEPLRLAPKASNPSLTLVLAQTSAALLVIYVGSRIFVSQIDSLGPALGLSPQLLALLVSPIATELPEILNAVIWIRQGKVRLALANISGAMMIQATTPAALGLWFTPWRLEPALLMAGGVTAAAAAVLFVGFRTGRIRRRWLAGLGLGYVGFLGLLDAVGLI
jgi:cation:H+ antiporter